MVGTEEIGVVVCTRRVGTEEREVEACPRRVETEEKVVRGRAQAVVLKLEKVVAQEYPRDDDEVEYYLRLGSKLRAQVYTTYLR